ncbi:MAG TPA: hypothetical protein ENJ20_06755 [Bacteroidetes bacterium]|nr:hypothetical protein [Bacteroidota bacterium]
MKELKKEFREKFPYLKLEFYKGRHEDGKPSPATNQLDDSKKIGEVRTIHKEGELQVRGNMKVSTFENRFREQYGLNVQVFRRSGNIWLQTTTTDHWTLARQNGKGERSEKAYKEMHGK